MAPSKDVAIGCPLCPEDEPVGSGPTPAKYFSMWPIRRSRHRWTSWPVVAMTAVIAVLGGFSVRVDREAGPQRGCVARAVPRLLSTALRRTCDRDHGER